MDRDVRVSMWDDFRTGEPGSGSLERSLSGLTPEQASGGGEPSKAEIAQRDFEEPSNVTPEAWKAAQARLAATHGSVRAAISDGSMGHAHFRSIIPHDSYHLGQIMQLRGCFGIAPLA